MKAQLFLQMITELRQREAIMLYGNLLQVSEKDKEAVQAFLEKEYQRESLEYPDQAPLFDPAAALWAAKFVYFSAQLMLYRNLGKEEMDSVLLDFPGTFTPSAILSADLCLRFIPHMIIQLKLIDSEDALIEVLERQLRQWHYSGIDYSLDPEDLDLSLISRDACLHQLYCNRIIKYKHIKLALNVNFRERVLGNLGMYAEDLWNDLHVEIASTRKSHT